MKRSLWIVVVTLVAMLGCSRALTPTSARVVQRNPTARPVLERRENRPPVRQRVADASHAEALFASHSWYVAPPPPPPVAPPPPPPPAAPPFPYTFVGAYTSQGDGTVYFLAQGDRVVDAHVGDRLEGVYEFESATAAQLTFNYLPLNIRQLLPTGAPQ